MMLFGELQISFSDVREWGAEGGPKSGVCFSYLLERGRGFGIISPLSETTKMVA